MKKIKVIELFGGIGAPRKALQNLEINCEFDYVELDKNSVASYNAMYNEKFMPIDVKDYHPKWTKVDWIMGGFPCQDISTAGNQAGLNENTRSNLFLEMVRICLECDAKNILFENVKTLLNDKHWPTFIDGIKPLLQKGYQLTFQKINAKQFIPQNRERIFILLSKDKIINIDLSGYECKGILKDYLQKDNIDEQYYKIAPFMKKALEEYQKTFSIDKKYCNKDGKIYFKNLTPFVAENYFSTEECKAVQTITATGAQSRQKLINIKEYSNFFITPRESDQELINGSYNRVWKDDKKVGALNCTAKIKIGNIDKKCIRYITELECWRLMGFNDSDFEKASKVSKKTQLYKQAGNSIVVNVLECIFQDLIKMEQ